MKNTKRTIHDARHMTHIAILLTLMICFILPQVALAAEPVAMDITSKVIKDTQNGTLNTLKLQASDADLDTLTYTLISLPGHGQLKEETVAEPIATAPYTLSSNKLRYGPEPGFTGSDSFTYQASDGSSSSNIATVTINVTEWFAPIGIPEPEFGIKETYRMYDDPTKRNPALTYTQNSEGGYYTHYIDNTDPNATDTGNPYGTASKPRKTIPENLPAGSLPPGSIVEIHNGVNPGDFRTAQIGGVGTAERPIFVRGINMPRLDFSMEIGTYENARYIIVEGISFFGGTILGRAGWATFETSYISVRNSDFHGDENGGEVLITSWTSNYIHNIVFYNNVVHDNGIWDPLIAEGDRDIGHIKVWNHASYVWIVDNEVYHVESSGIAMGEVETDPHHIYVGRNIVHHNKQTGLWTKTAFDVIFSENIAYGHRPSSSSSGGGMGFQADPKRVWFLFNRIYDNELGIESGSGKLGGREEIYFIGNVIYDVKSGFHLNDLNTPEPAKLIGNTIYNSENGIMNWYYNSKFDIINNIISSSDYHVYFGADRTSSFSSISYTLFKETAKLRWGSTYTNLSQFQQATGKGQNSIEADPLFVDAANGDFHLQSTSPAIDAGTSSGVVQEVFDRFQQLYGIDIRKDIEGRTRPQGSAWDIGAYEYSPDSGTFLYGDVSGDSEISAYDAALTAQAAVDLITLTPDQTKAAEVSGDGEVTAYDAALIAQKAVGLIEKFPVEG